jgi:hypothetical protein
MGSPRHTGLDQRLEEQFQSSDPGTASLEMMLGQQSCQAQWILSLRILELVAEVYDQIPDATISPSIIDLKIWEAHWVPKDLRKLTTQENLVDKPIEYWLRTLDRGQTFACIAMFESGRFNVNPEQLSEVIALGVEDSLFVAGAVLSDPSISDSASKVRHLIGNTGHSGMVFLVSPLEPRIRQAGYDPFAVEHRIWDGTRRDDFSGTSLHLSFTEWKMPLDWENTGEIDKEVFLLESIISVQHRGKWVADIDVLSLNDAERSVMISGCNGSCESNHPSELSDVVTFSSWDELLDPPPTPGIFRAQGNWVARLAAASILCQQGQQHCLAIIPEGFLCWKCFAAAFECPENHIPQFIID